MPHQVIIWLDKTKLGTRMSQSRIHFASKMKIVHGRYRICRKVDHCYIITAVMLIHCYSNSHVSTQGRFFSFAKWYWFCPGNKSVLTTVKNLSDVAQFYLDIVWWLAVIWGCYVMEHWTFQRWKGKKSGSANLNKYKDTTILVSLEIVIGQYISWYKDNFFPKEVFKFPDILTALCNHKILVLCISHFKIKINIDFPTK